VEIEMPLTGEQRSLLLREFNGSHHVLPGGCPKVLRTFSGDFSNTVEYRFNSLGFRGEEFRPDAPRHLFAAGCSITLGLGLEYSDAWVSIFRRGYAAIHGLPESDIGLQNFATGGCSNGYISRTLIGQCDRFPPSLALAAMTFPDRMEVLDSGRSYNIGRWCTRDSFDRGAPTDGHTSELRQMIREKAKAFYDLYTPLQGEQDVLKNTLLLQLFFQTRNIPFLIAIIRPGAGESPDHGLVAPWLAVLDSRRVFTIPHRQCLVDQSAAAGHPGRAGSLFIAECFLTRYRQVHGHPAGVDGNPGPAIPRSHPRDTWPAVQPPPEDPNVYPLF
jgi:hypothetical protein